MIKMSYLLKFKQASKFNFYKQNKTKIKKTEIFMKKKINILPQINLKNK